MNQQKHNCTKHTIILCPEAKEIVLTEKAKIKHQSTISDAINKIIRESKK